MIDLVINHCSSENKLFIDFLNGSSIMADFFIVSDKKFKQIEGLEKLSILQKNYRGLKRKVTRNRLKMESIALLVVSIY